MSVSQPLAGAAPVNVICAKWGTRYNGPYVNTLAAMVARHLKRPHRFICFTDDSSGFSSRVEARPLPYTALSERAETVPEGAWNKLGLLSKSLSDLSGPTLFLDLDIVITGNLDPFFEFEPGRFCIIRDFRDGDKGIGNSSVFRFQIGAHEDALQTFLADPVGTRHRFGNEQKFLSLFLREQNNLHFWPDGWCCSFKKHCLPPTPMNWFQEAKLPTDARIVVFHGLPNPADAVRGVRTKARLVRPVAWVKEHWRE